MFKEYQNVYNDPINKNTATVYVLNILLNSEILVKNNKDFKSAILKKWPLDAY